MNSNLGFLNDHSATKEDKKKKKCMQHVVMRNAKHFKKLFFASFQVFKKDSQRNNNLKLGEMDEILVEYNFFRKEIAGIKVLY